MESVSHPTSLTFSGTNNFCGTQTSTGRQLRNVSKIFPFLLFWSATGSQYPSVEYSNLRLLLPFTLRFPAASQRMHERGDTNFLQPRCMPERHLPGDADSIDRSRATLARASRAFQLVNCPRVHANSDTFIFERFTRLWRLLGYESRLQNIIFHDLRFGTYSLSRSSMPAIST